MHLQMQIACVIAVAGAAAALNATGQQILVGETAVPTTLAAVVPTLNLSWGAPMIPRVVGTPSRVAIGTDENDCRQKDASRTNVAATPTTGFVNLGFTAPAPAWYRFEFDIYAPDSLANSFWLQWDHGGAVELGTGRSRMAAPMPVQVEDGDLLHSCFHHAAGPHEMRLYAREAGTAIAGLRVYQVPPPVVLSAAVNCAPCLRDGPIQVTLRLGNFCGPAMFHGGLVVVNGTTCADATHVGQDSVTCTLPASALSGVADKKAASAVLGVRLLTPQNVTGDEYALAVALLVVVKPTPTWVFVVSIACFFVAFAGGAAVLTRCLLGGGSSRDNSKAPLDGDVGIIFTDVIDSTVLWAQYTQAMAAALDVHHSVVRRVIDRHGGYEVKTIGDAFMIACRGAADALRIARDIQRELHEQAWPVCITNHYLGVRGRDEPTDVRKAGSQDRFCGLRVRMGVSVGRPDVRLDAVTAGYDYYGPDVNLASRLESVGGEGQILTTHAVVNSVDLNTLGLTEAAAGECFLKGIGATNIVEIAVAALPAGRALGIPESALSPASLDRSGGTEAEAVFPLDASEKSTNRLFDDVVPRLCDTLKRVGSRGGGYDTKAVRDMIDHRRSVLTVLLKPLPPDRCAHVTAELLSAWRISDANRLSQNGDRAVLALIERVLPVEVSTAKEHACASHADEGSACSRKSTAKDAMSKYFIPGTAGDSS